jgi:hypothetical protein
LLCNSYHTTSEYKSKSVASLITLSTLRLLTQWSTADGIRLFKLLREPCFTDLDVGRLIGLREEYEKI